MIGTQRVFVMFALLVVLGSGLHVSASVREMEIVIQAGEDVVVIHADPVQEAAGYFRYVGSYTSDDELWSAAWNYWVNPDPLAVAVFDGQSEVLNASGQEIEFTFTTTVRVCPQIMAGSRLGATLAVTLFTDANGGFMRSFGGTAVWAVMADGTEERTVFDHPFYLSSSGQGIATLSAVFGTPLPSEPAGAFEETLGIRRNFLITPGEIALFTSFVLLLTDEESSEACFAPGDFNEDGVVDGQDLLILVQSWGDCSDDGDCIADLNQDGVVDGMDLLILLNNWTGPPPKWVIPLISDLN